MRLIEEEDRKGPFGETGDGDGEVEWRKRRHVVGCRLAGARLGLGPPVRFATATVSVTVQIRSLE
jgi:hypothetical protein